MMPVRSFIRTLRRLSTDTEANAAIIFGFSLLPAIGLIGLGIDFAAANMANRKLAAAADAVVLDAVSKSSNANLTAPSQQWAQSTFGAVAGKIPNVTVSNVTLNSSYVAGNLQVSLSYQASMKTSFGSLFNVPYVNLVGTTGSTAPTPNYANFYFLLDNSPSMGFAATDADVTKMQAATGGCAFACHQHSFSSGNITGDNTGDNYHIAKTAGVTTRIDMLRTSTQQVLDTALAMEKSSSRYQSAVYTFSDVLQTISPLSTNLTSVKADVGNVDLAYAYFSQKNIQTDYDTALQYIGPIVGKGGDGSSSSSPSKYLLIVTDGVEDQPVGAKSGSGDTRDHWPSPNQATTSPPSSAQSNLANTHTGNVSAGGYNRLIATIDPAQCDAIKANNVQIAILYTQYIPQPNDSTYNQYVSPIIDAVPAQLKKCASSGLFYTVNPSQDISASMVSIFTALASGQPRLTY